MGSWVEVGGPVPNPPPQLEESGKYGGAWPCGYCLPEAVATERAVMQMINVSSLEGRGPQEIGVDEFKRETPCLNRTTLENKYCPT